MLTQVFKSILLMSAAGSLLTVFLLCLKPVTQKLFSPNWQYYIWLTVLIVMILPVHFNVPHHTPSIPTAAVSRAENIKTEIPKMSTQTADTPFPEQAEKISVPKIALPSNIFFYLAKIWFLGMLAVFLARIVKYNLFLKAIHKNSAVDTDIQNIPKRLTVRKTDMLDAPLIAGLFKPKLFLPNISLSGNDMNYILMHELTHYKRCDLLYKWFTMAVLSVHWFNPFVYIVSRQIDTECEVSCDFAVTSKFSDSEKNNYMSMILDMLSRSKSSLRSLTTQMASGKKTLKRRFAMIRNKKTTSKFMSVISTLIAVIILSTTVLASGILTDFSATDYTIEVYNGENRLSLKNDPFIYDGEYYLPLRDILNGFDISNITYNNGEITVKIPKEKTKYETDTITIKIGSALIQYENSEQNGYGVVMRYAPVLRNDTTFVTIDYFEDLMKSFDLQGFRLNVIRPTEPENYYIKDEKVFIGTAAEQDTYSGELVKRIIIDENGEVIAVIPIEYQIAENIEQKFNQAEKGTICEGFYQAFYNQAFSCHDTYYDSVYESNLCFIDKNDEHIAYFGIADIIKIPQNEFNKDLRMTVTNTYANESNKLREFYHTLYNKEKNPLSSALFPIDDKTALKTIPNYEAKQQRCYDITEQFFEAFSNGDTESMKKYCTNELINDYFRNDKFLNMSSGRLKTVYSIRSFSNGDYYVHLKMTSDDLSAGNDIYYAVFEEQPNGEFLMKAFQESYSDEWEAVK